MFADPGELRRTCIGGAGSLDLAVLGLDLSKNGEKSSKYQNVLMVLPWPS
jgi:hypothetical protein